MVNVAEVAPCGTVTIEGTPATKELELKATVTPPEGAGKARVTMPVVLEPPTTVVGLTVRLERTG